MQHHLRERLRPARLLTAAAALAVAVMVAACGSSSPTVPNAPTRSSSSTASASNATGLTLAFSTCMRANGVPNFPDPTSGGGIALPSGIDPAAPAFRAAQAKCQKLIPGGGPLAPGSTTHPSARTLAKLIRIARCMRRHGVAQFPDPQTSVPNLSPAGPGVVSDFDGAILMFPSTIDMEAPAYRQALTACGAPPLGLPH
jgi:hypothetical protein